MKEKIRHIDFGNDYFFGFYTKIIGKKSKNKQVEVHVRLSHSSQ